MAENKVTDRASAVNLVMTDCHPAQRSEDICVQNLVVLQSLSQMAYRAIVSQPVWNALPLINGFDEGYWLEINNLVNSCVNSYEPTDKPTLQPSLKQYLACLLSLLDRGLDVLRPIVQQASTQSWYNYVYTLWVSAQLISDSLPTADTPTA